MKIREEESAAIGRLWPLRPFDIATVPFIAILTTIFGSNGSDSSGWLWLWAGTSLGLLIILSRVHRRVRWAASEVRQQHTHDE